MLGGKALKKGQAHSATSKHDYEYTCRGLTKVHPLLPYSYVLGLQHLTALVSEN